MTEAVRYLEGFVGKLPSVVPRRRVTPPPKSTLWSFSKEQVWSHLVIPAPYFVERGFDPGVLTRMDVGYSERLKKAIVPLYDDDDRLCVGIMERSRFPFCEECRKCHRPGAECRFGQPKWFVQPKDFPKGKYLYNFAAARRPEVKQVFLVEGPGDVWRMAEAGVTAVACLGSAVSPEQAKKLPALQKVLVVAFDNDGPGRAGAYEACGALWKHTLHAKLANVPAAYHDIGDMPAAEVAAWAAHVIKVISSPPQVKVRKPPPAVSVFRPMQGKIVN